MLDFFLRLRLWPITWWGVRVLLFFSLPWWKESHEISVCYKLTILINHGYCNDVVVSINLVH